MSDDPSVYDDEIDLRAASNRLLSAAVQSQFDKIIEAEGPNAPNAIARALKIVAGTGRPSTQETTAT
jgi:hypothetical protein